MKTLYYQSVSDPTKKIVIELRTEGFTARIPTLQDLKEIRKIQGQPVKKEEA